MAPRTYAAINAPSRKHGERIRKTRLRLGMTQTDLGKLFGVWKETICRIECGHFDITKTWPKYQILNERMRIWAEMNKKGKPIALKPHSSARSRYWDPINQARKENKNGRKNSQ